MAGDILSGDRVAHLIDPDADLPASWDRERPDTEADTDTDTERDTDTDASESRERAVFQEQAEELAAEYPNIPSLKIDWHQLKQSDPAVANAVLENPQEGEAAFQHALQSSYTSALAGVPVRFLNLPEQREFRVGKYGVDELGELVSIEAEVVEIDAVTPLAEVAAFECQLCGTLTRINQSYGKLMEPSQCQGCEETKGSTHFKFNREQSQLVDYQKIIVASQDSMLEEPPISIVFLLNDLTDTVGPGDRISLVGIYETFPFQDDSRLSTYVEAVAIEEVQQGTLTEADSVSTAELDEMIETFIDEHQDAGSDGEFGVPRSRVVDELEERGIRQEEIQDRIDELLESTAVVENGDVLIN